MNAGQPKIFLNFSTVSPMCPEAYEASRAYLEDFYRMGPPEVLYQYEPLADELSKEAARLLGCDPSEITFTKNTTEGINIAAEALPLEAGDEILLQAGEYPANRLPWLKKRQDGLTVSVVPASGSAEAFDALLSAIGPRTRAVTISSAQHYDGYMADLTKLSKICREKDIFLVVDAAQTTGIRRLNLSETHIDILVCGGQKYLQAGMGCGLLYVKDKVMPRLRHARVGSRSMQVFDDDSYILKPGAARFQDGTQNLQGIISLHAALKRVNTVGIEQIEAKSIALLSEIKAILSEHDIEFIDQGDSQSNIVSMKVPDPAGLAAYLAERAIYIKAVKDVARLSFTDETLVEDIRTLAAHTQGWLRR